METRRRFLEMAGCTIGAGCLGLACSSTAATPASGTIAAGNTKSVAVGSLALVPGQPLILGRDARGLYAMTAICPHQQCSIGDSGTVSPTEIKCNCHGSRFSANGDVTGGPAPTGLEHYKVVVAGDGAITINASLKVGKDERTAVA